MNIGLSGDISVQLDILFTYGKVVAHISSFGMRFLLTIAIGFLAQIYFF